jgi:hypothetical protein
MEPAISLLVQKSPPLFPIRSQLKAFRNFSPYYPKIFKGVKHH